MTSCLTLTRRPAQVARSLFAILAACLLPAAADAQLRPLDPLDWTALRRDVTVTAWLGAGRFADQRASLAGTQGTLNELGNFQLAWHTGRVLLEAGGTVRRTFRDDSVFRPPYVGVRGAAGPGVRRASSGDYRLFTTVRLTPEDFPAHAALRFGTRLPTTDNQNGLDRDLTDFYALVDLGYAHGRLETALETGIGIIGARYEDYEQADVIQYAGSAAYHAGRWTPSVTLLGQATTAVFQAVGTENLAEVRPALQFGARRWVRVAGVFGVARYSPSRGVLVSAGLRR